MKSISLEELFAQLEKGKVPPSLLVQGEDAYLLRELKNLLKKAQIEIKEAEIKKQGPEAALEDLSMGGSLFSTASLLWIQKTAPLSGWKAEAKNTWERISERVDGQSFFVLVQVPQDRRMNWTALKLQQQVSLNVDSASRLSWLKRMNDKKSQPLSLDRLRFLAQCFEEPLLTYDNWIELWTLGGDVWASSALGWVDGSRSTTVRGLKLDSKDNPAFLWVDAVLQRDRKRALQLLDILLENGAEPLQLLALVSKSVRILSGLETGQKVLGQPEFLVNKMRQIESANRRNQVRLGSKLLHKCADIDRKLKSGSGTGAGGRALLASLS